MTGVAMSRAAAGLLRSLLDRSGADRNRILLSNISSTEWQSLTFSGERHELGLRVYGAGADAAVQSLTAGLEDAEFSIPGQIVADIALAGPPVRDGDGSVLISIEALTIKE